MKYQILQPARINVRLLPRCKLIAGYSFTSFENRRRLGASSPFHVAFGTFRHPACSLALFVFSSVTIPEEHKRRRSNNWVLLSKMGRRDGKKGDWHLLQMGEGRGTYMKYR
jgi:hypothetical protein